MSGYAQAPVGSTSPLNLSNIPPKDPKGDWPKPNPKPKPHPPPQNPPQNPPANSPSQTRSQAQSYNAPQYPAHPQAYQTSFTPACSPYAAGSQPTQYPNYGAPKSASHPTGLEKKGQSSDHSQTTSSYADHKDSQQWSRYLQQSWPGNSSD